jgi:hypothetical protein
MSRRFPNFAYLILVQISSGKDTNLLKCFLESEEDGGSIPKMLLKQRLHDSV